MDILTVVSEINKHIAVLNADSEILAKNYSQLSIDVAVLQAQMESMVFWTRTIVAAFVGLMATQVWQLLLMSKKEKK